MNSNVVANKKTIQFLVILILGLLLGFGVMLTTREGFSCGTSSHVVVEGDTLWGIAEDNCSGNIQKASDDLLKVYGSPLEVGNTVYLPKSDKCKLSIEDVEGQEYIYEECE